MIAFRVKITDKQWEEFQKKESIQISKSNYASKLVDKKGYTYLGVVKWMTDDNDKDLFNKIVNKEPITIDFFTFDDIFHIHR